MRMNLRKFVIYLLLTNTNYVKGSCAGTLQANSFTTAQKTFTIVGSSGSAQIPGGNQDWSYWFTETDPTCSINSCDDDRLYSSSNVAISTGTNVNYSVTSWMSETSHGKYVVARARDYS